MKTLLAAILAMLMTACSTNAIQGYFTSPQTFASLQTAWAECLLTAPSEYAVGAMYVRQMKTGDIANPNQVQAVLQCGGTIYTVTCDVTKQPNENPCGPVTRWSEIKSQ